jgi:hypothetical protein
VSWSLADENRIQESQLLLAAGFDQFREKIWYWLDLR